MKRRLIASRDPDERVSARTCEVSNVRSATGSGPGILRARLRGSALVEAMVASVIFLVVFMMSLETITRLTITGDTDQVHVIEADHRADLCLGYYGDGAHPPGSYAEEYPWGKIITEISVHRRYDDMLVVKVCAVLSGSGRRITYRRTVRRDDT